MEFENYLEKNEIIDIYKKKNFFPTINNLKEIYCYLIDYIKENQLIIFGGLAVNKFLPNDDKIYEFTKDTLPDIDIYSPNARNDIIKMSNMLHNKGIKNILAKDGVINNLNGVLLLSYNIYIEGELGKVEIMNCVNINKYIYDKIPKKKFNNIYYVKPGYQKIDMLLSLSNSITSYNRWEKDYSRYMLLSKYYPFIKYNTFNDKNKNIDLKLYLKPLYNQTDVIIGGYLQYLFLINLSQIKNIPKINISYLEVYTTHVDKYIKIYKNIIKNCNIKLYETFVTILPEKYVICQNNIPKIIIYNIKNRPTQYIKYKGYLLLSYDMLLLTCLCNKYIYCITKDNKEYILYYLNLAREKYLKDNNKTIFNNTIFKSFVVDSLGEYINMQFKYRTERKISYKPFTYRPEKVKTLLKTNNKKNKKYYREKIGTFIKIYK